MIISNYYLKRSIDWVLEQLHICLQEIQRLSLENLNYYVINMTYFKLVVKILTHPGKSLSVKLLRSEFKNLTDATWALIGHEIAATSDLDKAMFSKESDEIFMDLSERIQYYKNIGMKA